MWAAVCLVYKKFISLADSFLAVIDEQVQVIRDLLRFTGVYLTAIYSWIFQTSYK